MVSPFATPVENVHRGSLAARDLHLDLSSHGLLALSQHIALSQPVLDCPELEKTRVRWGLTVARYACRTWIAKLSPNCSWVLFEKHRGFGNTDAV
jgi:hypothetical protein